MTIIKEKIITDTWIDLTWEDYLTLIENITYKKAKFYYFQGKAKIEMSPLGNSHSLDHAFINYAIYLYATFKEIVLNGRDNCSYRKVNYQEVQPDLSFYIGENVDAIPWGTSIINLDEYPTPNLVIEVANTTLADDLGQKRLFYEDLQVEEYWVVDVNKAEIIAFKIENNGSYRINESQLLTGLKISLLTEALKMSRQTNHTAVGSWLLTQFQNKK